LANATAVPASYIVSTLCWCRATAKRPAAQ
jgi:hypothetical protein